MGASHEPTAAALRRLAQELAWGPYPSEDASQEAWLAWLRKPVDGSALLGWLRGARRRGARSILRDEARRREREERYASDEATESPLDVLVRLERARKLIAAVEGLEEPFRTAVVARFFEELPPRALARRLGIPVNTARSRVRRGLEELRRRLDPEVLHALAPWPEAPRASLEKGGPLLVLGLVALLGGLGWQVWRAAAPARDAAALTLRSDVAVPTASTEATPPGRRDALAPAPAPAVTPPSAASDPATAAGTGRATVRGRLIDERGLPGAGLPLRVEVGSLHVALDPRDAVQGFRGDVPFLEFHAVSDTEGRFELELVPDPVAGYQLWVEPDEFVPLWRDLGQLAPGTRELGEIVLQRGATLAGRIATPDGRPCGGAWSVQLRAASPGEEELSPTIAVDPASGAFRLERLPPGRSVLRAESWLGGECAPLALELFAGETRTVELLYTGPDLARRALVVLSTEHGRLPRLALEALSWSSGGEVRRHVPSQSFGNGFLFEELPDGPGTLTLQDERCETLRLSGVHAGRTLELTVRGSAGVRLEVRRIGGASLASFRAAWRARNVVGAGERLWDGAAAPAGTVLDGLFPGAGVLVVEADGHGAVELELELLPGELRPVAVELPALVSVRGVVQDESGALLAGVQVSVLAPARSEDSSASPVLRLGLALEGHGLERHRREIERVASDAEGRFHFALPPGPHILAVLPPETLQPVAFPLNLAEDEAPTGLILRVPRLTSTEGER